MGVIIYNDVLGFRCRLEVPIGYECWTLLSWGVEKFCGILGFPFGIDFGLGPAAAFLDR